MTKLQNIKLYEILDEDIEIFVCGHDCESGEKERVVAEGTLTDLIQKNKRVRWN